MPSNCSPSTGNKGQRQRLRRLAMLHNAGEELPRQRLAAKGLPQPVGHLRAYCGAAYSGRIVIPASPEKSALSRTDSRQSRGVLIGQLQQAVLTFSRCCHIACRAPITSRRRSAASRVCRSPSHFSRRARLAICTLNCCHSGLLSIAARSALPSPTASGSASPRRAPDGTDERYPARCR